MKGIGVDSKGGRELHLLQMWQIFVALQHVHVKEEDKEVGDMEEEA
jgi:hypothetical protein